MTPEIRLLTPDDHGALQTFLDGHAPQAMFLRANLARSSIRDGNQPYQGRYAAAFDGERIVGVAAHYWNGIAILLAPAGAGPLVSLAVGTRPVSGLIGRPDEVAASRSALGFDNRQTRLNAVEDLLGLNLNDLRPPPALMEGTVVCCLATPVDIPLLGAWRFDFDKTMNGAADTDASRAEALVAVKLWESERSLFLLCDAAGQPLSTCCFNARLPDMVQIGSVWTPPELRGRGYAGAVVAGALRHAAAEGARDGILFTAIDNQAARQAYVAIGFTRIGDYAILLFADTGD